jgi:outer membrane protein assembly factor BamB
MFKSFIMIYLERKPIFIFLLSAQMTGCSVFAQVNMFRGTADHINSFTTKTNIVFGEESWKFNADAPIRSTVVCNKSTVYFGSSKNLLYALDKKSGAIKWQFNSGYAIESSPALCNNAVYFSNNRQTLYSLNAQTGKQNWKLDFGKSLEYDWGFDYYYSSPTIIDNKILIGIKDGFVYNINANEGKIIWKFKTEGIVRSTPAISGKVVFFGDTNGILYAVDLADGKEIWRFKTIGNGLKNEDFGFDRRAIISSPVVASGKIIFGCRDGLFYAVSKDTGKELWHVDHHVSWVISSIAVKDSIAVTGTSAGRFVQAVDINTGKEIWKYKTVSFVWSSPVIYNNKVYIGSQEGVLYCLDLLSGKKINSFQASGKIFSSPVISDSLLYFGTDQGNLYALKPGKSASPAAGNIKRYVFWEKGADKWFEYGNDLKIKIYLNVNNYTTIDSKKLEDVLRNTDSAAGSVIVFASNYFPKEIYAGYDKSLLRQYLNKGGRVLVLGNNPLLYQVDSAGNVEGFNFLMADSVLNIKTGPNDLRSMGGLQPAFPTDEGLKWGLKKPWTSLLPLQESQVDIVLGKDENGMVSSWVKKFSNIKGSGFIQLWMDEDFIEDMSPIVKVAEYEMD